MANGLDFIHHYAAPSNGSRRVLLLLHGTGGNESDLLPLGHDLDPDAAVLSPRGKILENGAPRFFRRLAEGVFDEEDVVRRANELADFILAAEQQYEFSVDQLVAVGYSNGANIAAAVILLRPEVLQRAVLFRAMLPLQQPPQSDLRGTALLISAGRYDPIVPLANVQRLTSLLQSAGANVQLAIQQASHGLVPEDLSTAKDWLRQA